MPTPNTAAPGMSAVQGMSGARGMCQLTKIHAANGMAMIVSGPVARPR